MKRLITASLLTSMFAGVLLAGCQPTEDDLLAEYRRAIPSKSVLQASSVRAASKAVGDPAVLPPGSIELATGINGAVGALIDTLDAVVALPPTVYNSETLEFVWGPFPNDDGVGTVAVYIRDVGDTKDFRYEFAFLRGIDNDVAKLTPIIIGGATPDETNDDHGVGVALYDFEANAAFEDQHNPDHGALDHGRIGFLFAAGPDEKNPANELGLVVAAFRGFVSVDNPEEPAADIDYLYGRYIDNSAVKTTIDFLNFTAPIDVQEDGSAREDLDVRLAFINEGAGRGEAVATGGDLATGETATLTECWDDQIKQNFLELSLPNDQVTTEGSVDNCGLFRPGLATLGVPSVSDIPADLYKALSDVAATGKIPE